MSATPAFGDDILVRTRLLAPRLPRRWLARERLDRALSAIVEYPLTVVRASAGYGKSAALASYASTSSRPAAWLDLEGCDDPLVFLVHLVHACRTLAPNTGERTLETLRHNGSQAWAQALNLLVNDLVQAPGREMVLVLDDYHAVDGLPEIRALIERLIALRPQQLHLVLATRRRPQLATLPTLQARGELLEIDEQELAFTSDEIATLFRTIYGQTIDPEQARTVWEETGGWPIALQLLGIGSATGTNAGEAASALRPAPVDGAPRLHSPVIEGDRREALFAYLAQEVLARQPDDVQAFLLRTSVLAELRPDACDYVLGVTSSAEQLEALYGQGLFMVASGGGTYRYHPLFHRFLHERAAALPEWSDLHARAAEYYRNEGAGEQVLYHLRAVGDVEAMARELAAHAQSWLSDGRLVTLLAWIDQLPREALEAHPELVIDRGDAARLLGKFEISEQAYEQAQSIYAARHDSLGQAQALRGQALIYTDTMQPRRAEVVLRQALKLLHPEGTHNQKSGRAELLELLAASWADQGKPARALRLHELLHTDDRPRSASNSGSAQGNPATEHRLLGALVRLGRLMELVPASRLKKMEQIDHRRYIARGLC